jgi:hypothetical protein
VIGVVRAEILPARELERGPRADNGGPTQTMTLLPGSPAIDAGVTVPGLTTDQRTVTLTPRSRLAQGGHYLLNVSGASPHGLVDVAGVRLVGTNAGGKPRSDYIAMVHGAGPWVAAPWVVGVPSATRLPAGPHPLACLSARR